MIRGVAGVDELLRRNLLEVFGERDGERRRAAMATVLGADVLFQDPEGAVRGRDEVDAKVAALLADAPFVFRLTGPVRDQSHLHGLIERFQEVGIELVSVNPVKGTAQ